MSPMHAFAVSHALSDTDRYLPMPARTSRSSYDQLREIAGGYVDSVEHWSCTREDVLRLSALTTELVDLADRAPEVCLAMGQHLRMNSPSMRHAFFVAIVGIQLGRVCGLDAGRLRVVAKAAMMMNLPSLQLQDDLAAPWAKVSMGQRITLARHPILAAELVANSPGADLRWIEAIEQHHEAMDGSGYPYALSGDEICVEARILKIADLWCAFVSPRPHRSGKSPREALHWMLTRHQQRLDPAIFDALRRMTGNYPPGTLIRLANREIAMITLGSPRGSASPRHVVTLLGPHNAPLRDPTLRDTSKSAYAVRGYSFLPQGEIRPAFWNKVWAASRRFDTKTGGAAGSALSVVYGAAGLPAGRLTS